MIAVGLFAFLLSVALLIVPAYAVGRIVARIVGLPGYCLFDVKPKGTLSRELVILLACTVVPLVVGTGVLTVAALLEGERVSTNRVEVIQDSPAQAAGLHAGDRVVRVDGTATPDFATIRAALGVRAATHTLTFERQGQAVSLEVSPDARGRFGVVAMPEIRKATLPAAITQALTSQWFAWSSRFLPAREAVELAGPVAIARTAAADRSRRWLYPLHLIGILQTLLCMGIAGTFANDWVTWLLFGLRRFKKAPAVAVNRQFARMQRLHHALKSNIVFIVLLMIGVAWVDIQSVIQADSSTGYAGWHLQPWWASFEAAVLPIIWLISRELYSLKKTIGITALMLIPIVNILVVLWHLHAAKQWLRNESASRSAFT